MGGFWVRRSDSSKASVGVTASIIIEIQTCFCTQRHTQTCGNVLCSDDIRGVDAAAAGNPHQHTGAFRTFEKLLLYSSVLSCGYHSCGVLPADVAMFLHAVQSGEGKETCCM